MEFSMQLRSGINICLTTTDPYQALQDASNVLSFTMEAVNLDLEME